MSLIDIVFSDLSTLIYIISILLVLIMIFLERTDPKTILFWTCILLLIPVIGFVFYLFFGQTFYRKRQFSVKNLSDEEISAVQEKFLQSLNEKNILPEHKDALVFAKGMMKAGGVVYSVNNKVDLFTEGEKFFNSFFEDLRNAKTFIHVEFYILRNDELGNEFMDILINKAKEGVKVRLMIDAIGNSQRKKIREFVRAGGEFTLFHRTLTVLLSPRKNNRNHRKIASIDGSIGYVAGFNIGKEYLGKGPMGDWRDSGVRIEGQGVSTITLRFLMDWEYAAKKKTVKITPDLFPFADSKYYGKDVSQLISGGPDFRSNPIELQYLKIINSAKDTLYIHTPYLVPSKTILNALRLSAMMGVDVRIIMPDRPDHPFVYWTSLWFAGEMMKNGVRVYQYNNGFVHSKTLVADGMYCSVGSANLDQRSMNLNFETNLMIYSPDIGKEMNDVFMKDLERSTELSLDALAKISGWQKFKMSISRLFSSLA